MALMAPAVAQASVRCHYDPATLTLSVSASGDNEATIRRAGPEIRVSELLPWRAFDCGAAVTVTNVDRIEIVTVGRSAAWIELANGPFAPGATAETEGSSEIELAISGSGFVEVNGGRGAEHFKFLRADGENGVNLNADEDDDLDIAVDESNSAFLAVFNGGGGPDLLDAAGNPGPSMFAVGGGGNDTLVAGGLGAIIMGGSGRDRIFGSPRFDLIDPGTGADLVKARGGSDLVELRADHSRDRIDCGAGGDGVERAEPFDRLRSCEIDLSR